MANLLVVIELRDHRPKPVCLEVLGQARRIASELGATLYAVVPLAHAPRYDEDDLIAQIARHGADKIVLVTDSMLGSTEDEIRWGTMGTAISMVSDLLPPTLLLLGATAGAREVAPRAAARIGAAFLSEAWLELRDRQLTLWEGEAEGARRLEGELEFPVVATIPPGRYLPAVGDEEAEVEVMSAASRAPDFEELGTEEDPGAAAFVEGAGEARPAAEALARVLGGTAGEARPGPDALPRLWISLGAPLPVHGAMVRVALGPDASSRKDVHYAVDGAAIELARALADAASQVSAAAPGLSGRGES